MQELVFYHYPKCSTCVKALRWLKDHGHHVRAIDITIDPPSAVLLGELARRSGLGLKRFFNTSGVSYREGGFKDKLAGMSESQALAALSADGKLIKRPILIGARTVLVGFSAQTYADADLG